MEEAIVGKIMHREEYMEKGVKEKGEQRRRMTLWRKGRL